MSETDKLAAGRLEASGDAGALVVRALREGTVPAGVAIEARHVVVQRHALADAAAERRRALAIEITFQPVPHRLVQQHAGPARAQHHGHGARGRGLGVQIHQRLIDGLATIAILGVAGRRQPPLEQPLRRERAVLLRYFAETGLLSAEAGIVDIGWQASSLKSVQDLRRLAGEIRPAFQTEPRAAAAG